MKVLLKLATMLLLCGWVVAGTPGSFRGKVVKGPQESDSWMYVEGHNHSVRRVYVRGAKVHYDSELPAQQRSKPIPKVVPVGTEVRVTAEQDDGGEWRATEIEILGGDSADEDKKAGVPTTSQS